jgi:lipid-binding SYLF domain-containing protein
MFLFRIPALALLLALLAAPLASRSASADSLNEAETLVLKSQAVFKSFMNDPGMIWFHENVHAARGILIVPQMLRGGFIVGGSGGSGVLLARSRGKWSYPAFYTIGSLSVGLQVGADASELVLLIMTERGLNAMLSTELKAGADISIAAGPMGKNAKAQTADVIAFGRAKGAFGGVAVEGAVIAPRDLWNIAYYGSAVSPYDILLRGGFSNSQADPLRKIMPTGSKWDSHRPSARYPAEQEYEFDRPYPGRQDDSYQQQGDYSGEYYQGQGQKDFERNKDQYQDQPWQDDSKQSWQYQDKGKPWRNPDQEQQQDWP